jgi:hypothetical protein
MYRMAFMERASLRAGESPVAYGTAAQCIGRTE